MPLNIAYENLVTCISIIDESSPSVSTHQSDWSSFRNNYPYRTFYLLQPTFTGDGTNPIYSTSRMNMPSNYINDPYANGTIQVNRDEGNVGLRSDWFALCNLDVIPSGAYVSVWLDISGSMVYATVQASYEYFVQRCNNAGINIILETSDSGERWIPGHNKDLPPSGDLKIVNPDNNAEVNSIQIVSGQGVTLTWYAFGEITSVDIDPTVPLINNVPPNLNYADTYDVTPSTTTTYIMTVTGPEGNFTRQVTVNVLVPPVVTLEADSEFIVQGTCTNLTWSTSGDADTFYWATGGLTNTNLTSTSQVCPDDTTTYCAYATGLGGTSPTVCATITVFQRITINTFSVPTALDYGTQGSITVDYSFANSSAELEVYHDYGNGPVLVRTVELDPSGSAVIGGTNTTVNATFDTNIAYDFQGPRKVEWRLNLTGSGGTATQTQTTIINIDETPDNLTLQETEDKFKDQEPVYTPDQAPDDVVLSDLYLIEGIDIPVEIKSNYPIKVDINKNDNWQDIRQR